MKTNLRKSQRYYLFLKRAFDLVGAFFAILLLSGLMLIVAIIIKLTSKGPILFRQERLGRDKKVFVITKFRSMRVGAPEIPPDNMTPEQQKAMTYRWGKFMRKTSIDELPQLFNIFGGSMSFIGPRPGAAKNEEELIRLREAYTPNAYDVKPGLSGYAQIMLKRDHNAEKKAEYDHYYVKKMNLWLDIKIFFYSLFLAFGFIKGR